MEITTQNLEAFNGVVKYKKYKWHVLSLLDFFKIVK